MRRLTVLLLAAGLVTGAAGPAASSAPPSLPPFDRSTLDGTMTLKRVEPGVVRVLDDGAGHDLTDYDTFEDPKPVSLLAAGDDGSVWMTSSGGFIKIGTPGEVPDPLDTFLAQMEIGLDGTLWIADGYRGSSIGEWRDESWTIHELPSDAWVVWLDATPGGGLDFAWRDETNLMFDRLPARDQDTTLAPLPPPLQLLSPDAPVAVARTLDGQTWVAESPWWQAAQRFEPGPLWVFDGTTWRSVEPLGELSVQPRVLALEDDGTLRVSWWEVMPGGSKLGSVHVTRREQDDSWALISGFGGEATGSCAGYARFEGQELKRYLDGICLRPAAITPSGDVWVFGHRRNRKHPGVYVILPAQ